MRYEAVAGVLLAGALTSLLTACAHRDNPARLVGTLERDRIEIIAEASEPVLSLDVREGMHVTEGQILLRQDTATAAAQIARADAQIAQARHRLTELEKGARIEEIDQARARVAAARAAVERDEREFMRVTQLAAQNIASQSQLDSAQAARNASRATLREGSAALATLLHGTRIEDLDQARAALAALEAARRELDISSSRLVVRATRAGTVDALPFRAGDRPPKGATVAVLLADTPSFARIYVPEPRRARVKAGDAARIYVDGLDRPLQGKVRYVASDAAFTPYFALTQRDRSRLTYLSEVEVTDSATHNLPAGVPVEVEIEE